MGAAGSVLGLGSCMGDVSVMLSLIPGHCKPITAKEVSAPLRSLALPLPLCRMEVKAIASQVFLSGSDGTGCSEFSC